MKTLFLIITSLVCFSCISANPNTEIVNTGLTDIANMFNERGYYKSNAISQDEQEIINDFNGNLMYNIPQFIYSLAGDINFNLSLNYNGSVGHQIFAGNLSTYESGTYERFNLNSPEWIINLNGIAIQTLNFETSFFTNDLVANEITGDNVKSLIPGYHFDGSLNAADASNPYNRIEILSGVEGVFGFTNTYFKNGNLQNQLLYGSYKDFMKNKYNLNYTYSYDNSNRLLTAVNSNQGDNTYSTYNTYDKDGNILTLRRYGDNNIIADNYNYQYFPNTNKVRFVSGATDQYNYDSSAR